VTDLALDLPYEAPPTRDLRVLDFDMESMAAGFADPAWVPQKITCIAWSWEGYDAVNSVISTQMGFFIPSIRAEMLAAFMPVYEQADMVTGHNLLRHDLPLLNAECMRLGLPKPSPKLVLDTMRLGKTKGLKKGQDNLGGLLRTQQEKQAMDWEAWEQAYEDPTWQRVRDRAESDVVMHKEIVVQMRERRWLKPPVVWNP
jgi:hypothetical protein